MFEPPQRGVRAFAFPSRGPSTPSVVAWASSSSDDVRPVVFRRSGPVVDPDPEPAPALEPEIALEASHVPSGPAPEPPAAFEEHAPPEELGEPSAETPLPWLDLPAPSLRPHDAAPIAEQLLETAGAIEERAALREAAAALTRARETVLANVEAELLELAVDIATVLIEDELATRPALHRTLVRAALAAVEPGDGVKVRASRATYEALLEAFDSATVDHGARRVQVELDDTVEGLGAVVQAGGGRVDGRVHIRIEALRRVLLDARRSRDAA